jgi:hypothetical protein
MKSLPSALQALNKYKQFMLYKLIPNGTKTTKLPCSVEGKVVDAHDSQYWVDSETACAAATRLGEGWGVAFTLTDDDDLFFIDIDNCLTGSTWSPIAVELCQLFAGAAVEVSQSGSGLHIIGSGAPRVGIDDHACKAKDPVTGSKSDLFDLYRTERFIALTGNGATGNAGSAIHQAALDHIVEKWLKLDPSETVGSSEWTSTHCEGSYPIEDDARLIEKALKAESVASQFGARASFRDLWTADADKLLEFFPPDQGGEQYDASAADLALAQHLAFYTGNNCERILRLMYMSGLKRAKWDKRPEYLIRRTIPRAVGRQTSWYSVGKPIEMTPVASVVDPVIRAGFQFLPITQVVDHFRGCVYVADAHRIFTPNGTMLKAEQFNSMFGGYTFSLDDTGEKTTKKAFEAFTENQGVMFPKVDGSVFDPRHPPGAIIDDEGRRMVNTYVPVNVRKVPGDVSRFMTHLAKILPNERDRQIALSYAAAIVQYPGHKFQWAPLFQGCEGNGKTLITRCVAYAVGQRYTHLPPASEISEKFNSWLFGSIFVGVEDIHVPDSKAEVLEILKPMITGDRLAKRAMQQDQVMMANCANFIFNSNHRNAIKKTLNDRRFCVFFTAQQQVEDIARDGMSGNYFPDLYDWLRGDGYAHVAHFLSTYTIPVEFNPTLGCQRAPYTSTTGEAVEASLGAVEQEVMECIEEGRQGFAGGWVSSMALDALIERLRMGRAIAPRKRRDLMKSIGYDWHPALKDGRVNNHILMDNGKPRLYIRQGHIHANLVGGAEVVRHYEAAQGDPVAIAALSQATNGN